MLRVPIRRRGDEIGGVLFDIARMRAALDDVGASDQFVQEGKIGGDAADDEFVQRARRAGHRGGVVGAVHDQLGEQRIERRIGRVTFIAERVDAHAGAGRRSEGAERSARGLDRAVALDLLHVDAQLHGEAARRRHDVLGEADVAQGAAARELDLHADEIDAGDFLGDGVLDLQAWIGLDEGEGGGVARRMRVDQELEGGEAFQVHVVGEPDRGVAELAAKLRIEARRGRDLHDLLVAPLQGAIALPDMARRASVAGDLDFDMARIGHQGLGIDRIVAEGGTGLGPAAQIGGFELGVARHNAHAAAAAAGDGLDDDRAARRLKERADLFQRRRSRRTRKDRHAEALGQGAGAGLVAEDRQHMRRGADEDQSHLLAVGGEFGVLAQEAVAGMDRLAFGGLGGGDDAGDVEIGGGSAGAQRLRRIRSLHMRRRRIVVGIDRDAAQPQIARRARDAHGDLAAVGD
ncbi:MAG: hypothetical protein WDM81_07830 [Rhizomicrobium sp.]